MASPRGPRFLLRRDLRIGAPIAAALGYAWFASGVRTFTRPAEVLTFVPGLAVLALTAFDAAPDPPTGRLQHRGALLWVVSGLALTGWELAELFSSPRKDHPTLSSLTDWALSTHPTRFLGYLGWLFLGWLLIRHAVRPPVAGRAVVMSRYAGIVTIYALLIGALLGLAVLSHRPGSWVPTLGRLVASMRSARVGRILLALVWWWAGWHVFVR